MAKNEHILAIDIGAESIKMAEFSYPSEGTGMVLEKFSFVEYGGDLKEEERLNALKESFKNAIQENQFNAKTAHVSISGQSAFVRFVKLPPMADKEDRVKQIVEYEAKQNVPFPIDEVVWDYQLIGDLEDEESEIEVMFVVVKNDIINFITDLITETGMDATVIDVAPAACYNAARANLIGAEDCVMILNIGSRNSTLVFIDSGRFYVRSIPIAGHTITQQVSREFGISYEEAEIMKKKHGFVALGGAYDEPESEVAATVSKIVRNVMTRLHGEINRSINVYRSQQTGSKPTKLFLSGGSTVMAFTNRFFSDKLKIPVEYFNPFQVVSLSDSIDREQLAEVAHMFSEVIGLGLRRVTTCPIEITLIPEILKKQQTLKKKIPFFYASAASVILCLLIVYWGFNSQKSAKEKLYKLGEEQITRTQGHFNDLKQKQSQLKSLQTEYENVKNRLLNRNQWVDVLNELQQIIPENCWIVYMEQDKGPVGGSSANAPKPHGGLKKIGSSSAARANYGAASQQGDVQWIRIIGHTLLMGNERDSKVDYLRNKFVESNLFTDQMEEVDITRNVIPQKTDINNLTTFEMVVKLKQPIVDQ